MQQRLARAFTLAELLVVMAIIAIIATITVVSVRGITNSARLSSGISTVTAALDNARALAMKNGRIVMVVFRPRLDGKDQYVEAVTAQWTGQTIINPNIWGSGFVTDRFVPIPDVAVRTLPRGIQVAGPSYGTNEDAIWATQVNLVAAAAGTSWDGECAGAILAVMYSRDGTVISRNSQSDSNAAFVDFNNNGYQHWQGDDYSNQGLPGNFPDPGGNPGPLYDQVFEDDEALISIAPFLAVYDNEEARERRLLDWSAIDNYIAELTGQGGFISANADRIHFNRYTGVVMR